MRNKNASATEWMEYYEKLFEEKHPVKGVPVPIEDDMKEQRNKDNN